MYYKGEGVRSNKNNTVKRQNRAEARRLLKKAANNNHPNAQKILDSMELDADDIIIFKEWE